MNGRKITYLLALGCVCLSQALSSCGKSKQSNSRELEASGYASTPSDFLKAATQGDRRALELILKNDIPLNSVDADGWSALHLASQGGHEAAVSFLLEAGISINTASSQGITPLMLTAQQGQADMVRFLLQQGATPNLKDQMNRSALILAIDGNHPRSVEELAPYSRDQLTQPSSTHQLKENIMLSML